jgi:hypothetical protein
LNCNLINPLTDARWDDFVEQHPSASPFHTRGWLAALQRTYGFEPVAITTSSPEEKLSNAIVFCRVRSWLTGHRLVSLPFSDHCALLVDKPEDVQTLIEGLRQIREREKWSYVELRPLKPMDMDASKLSGFGPGESFLFHTLDLRPRLEKIAAAFHKDCVLRKVRRAERDGLSCEEGRSENLLRRFYALQLQTRRRQNIPPQPYSWFKNLLQCMGEKLTVWIASLGGSAVAGIITISHGKTLVYKYGCSDAKSSAHGGTQLLFWKLIQQAKDSGYEQLDLGRSDSNNQGLITFKDRWGSAKSYLTYLRCPPTYMDKHINIAKKIADITRDLPLSRAGTLLYRHFA